MQWSCFVLSLRGIQRAFELNGERGSTVEVTQRWWWGSKLALESKRLPPLWVEHIKNWNMYLILVVECSFLYFWGEVLAINLFSNSQEPFTITCRNLFRFWFFFAFPLICVSFLSTHFEGQQSQQFLHHFKFNFNAHVFEIRTRGRGFFACHSARWKPK